jgi:WD40 repeat protein
MTPERWQQVKEIFQAALELPRPERAAYVSRACGDDEELQREVASLLQSEEQSEDFLHEPAIDYVGGEPLRDVRLRTCFQGGELVASRYQIVRLIGRGGMGEVYEAEDLELRAKVALKLVRPEMAEEPEVLERFKRETQLARRVTHPNVCRIFDLGYHVTGPASRISFLTMELLYGETLSDRLTRGRIDTAEALSLVRQLAAGLTAAHQAGVIHRDFKSANVILLHEDSPPHRSGIRLKITDFGIARAIGGSDTSRVTLQTAGPGLGTPAYMAPEQIEGGEITAATDIYALGIVMFEMVTGRLPFEGDTPWVVAIKRLRETPVTPSSLVPSLDRNWDAVILRCLEREPGSRFASAADVWWALSGEAPASPTRPVPIIAAWGRRRRLRALIPIGALMLLLAVALGYYLTHRSMRSAGKAADERAMQTSASSAMKFGWSTTTLPADASLSQITFASGSISPLQILLFGSSFVRAWEPGQALPPLFPLTFSTTSQAECNSGLWLIHDDNQHLTEWDAAKQKARTTVALPWLFHSAVCLDEKARAWGFLVNQNSTSQWIEFDLKTNRVMRAVPLAGEFLKATVDRQQRSVVLIGKSSVSVRTLDRMQEIFSDTLSETLLDHPATAWSESGRYLALGFKQLAVYDFRARKRMHTWPTTGWLSSVGWIGDEGISAIDDRGSFYWTGDLSKDWQLAQAPTAAGRYQPFWIPSHYRWLAISAIGQGTVWEYTTPSPAFDLPVSPLEIWSIAADPDNSNVAVAGKDSRIQIVDLQRRKIVRSLEGHTDGVPFVGFEQSDRLISSSDDKTIRLWDTAAGKLLETATEHQSLVNAFAMSPDKRFLVSVSSDSKIKLWQLPELRFVKDLGTTANGGAAAAFLIHDSEHLAVSDWKGAIQEYEGTAPDWSLQKRFQLGNSVVYMLCPGLKAWWAVVIEGDTAGFWRIPVDNLKQAVRVSSTPANYCATGNDGELTAAQFSNRIELWANSDGRLAATYRFAARDGNAVAISSHPPMVIAGFSKGEILAWSLNAR